MFIFLYVSDGLEDMPTSEIQPKVQPCSSGERMEYVKRRCENYLKGAEDHDVMSSTMSPTERLKYIRALKVDEEHKLLLCFPAKTGFSAFKSLLV